MSAAQGGREDSRVREDQLEVSIDDRGDVTITLDRTHTLLAAVRDALAQVGVEDFHMPATPNRVWAALQAAAKRDAA